MARRTSKDLGPLWQKLERLLGLEPDILTVEKRLRSLESKLLRSLEPSQKALFLEYEALSNERQELALARALEVERGATTVRRPRVAKMRAGGSTRRSVAKKRSNNR
jgi:hypothetical protein